MKKRSYSRGLTVTTIAATLLWGFPVVVSAEASAPDNTGTAVQNSPRTADVYIDEAVLEESRKAAAEGRPRPSITVPLAPQSDQRPPRATTDTPKRTPEQSQKLARENAVARNSVSTRDSREFTPDRVEPRAIGEEPDDNEVNACLTRDAENGFGRVYNRFTFCRRDDWTLEFFQVSPNRPPEYMGSNTFNLDLFAKGDDTLRRARVWAKVQYDSVEYDWRYPWDEWFTGPDIRLSLMAECGAGLDVCHASPGPATMPFIVWDNNHDWFSWDVYGHEDAGVGRDKISFSDFYMQAWGEGEGYTTIGPRAESERREMRCDSGLDFRAGQQKACIFNEVIPRLAYGLDDWEVREVARHIKIAQDQPNSTYPKLTSTDPQPRDKRIPGRYDPGNANAPGLHRITPADPEYKQNRDHKDGACFGTGPYKDLYVDLGLPEPPQQGVEECDEYPFASTLEGAGHPEWDFSVRAVLNFQNSTAGGRLGIYYFDDRILRYDFSLSPELNDRFYINITG
ncbi:hypothetical protein JOF41_000098 [Saccharothrix coeruleofusca]|uniref:NucA/NucB deoxyribonuclease domain-containing protein n=1 Tax=Saccharothrix coeruleofusca TaxID=33919 RepID=UPI001AE87D04|nr:hypothetical protein [Saccharothrix coeruleofusca]MBP2333920.1 hypothetical protein [Saccharothrix coeruleofusca]